MEALASIFQWFVLLATVSLTGLVVFRFARSLRQSQNTADTFTTAGHRTLFFTLGRPVFWRILALAAFSRLLLYGVAFLSARVFIDYGGSFFNSFTDLWQRSDAAHYISIASDGYVPVGDDRVFLVFLPFYPLVVKLLSFVFQNATASGMIISHISFMASCVLAYEVAQLMGYDEDQSFSVPILMCIFPASFFINGTFSEGLFLLLSAIFFHLLLRQKWIFAAILGLLAAFTRYYGVLLVIPFGIELAQDFAHGPKVNKRLDTHRDKHLDVSGNTRFAIRKLVINAASILLIPFGTVLFLIVNYTVSGNFFQFLIYQREHWNQELSFFFGNLKTLALNAASFDPPTAAARFIPEVIFIILTTALLIAGYKKKFPLSMFAYIGANFVLTISASWLLSFERYMFGVFPVFFLIASIGHKNRFITSLIKMSMAAGLFFLAIAYSCGKHVY